MWTEWWPSSYIALLLVAAILPEGESGKADKSAGSTKYNTGSLQISAGDVIYCEMGRYAGWRVDHVLLATSSSTVAHMWGYGSDGPLVEETWPGRVAGWKCWKGKSYGYSAAQNAMRDLRKHGGRSLFYHVLDCNCEHWVSYWTTGKVYIRRLGQCSGLGLVGILIPNVMLASKLLPHSKNNEM